MAKIYLSTLQNITFSMQNTYLFARKYQVDSLIGSGGQGKVYHLQNIHTRESVAIKVLDSLSKGDPEYNRWIQRFKREIDILKKLDHPNIVKVIPSLTAYPHLAMEYLQGKTLSAYVRTKGTLPVAETASIAIYVLKALDYAAAEHGLVHRDIKPANIFILSNGQVKLIDFGLARRTIDDACTLAGTLLGTPSYLSPEGWNPRTGMDTRSDLYSLGVVLYFSLLGRCPFSSATGDIDELKDKHLHDRPDLTGIAAKSPEMARIIAKLLEKEPAKRYQSNEIKDLIAEMEMHFVRCDAVEQGKKEIGERIRKGTKGLNGLQCKGCKKTIDPGNRKHLVFSQKIGSPSPDEPKYEWIGYCGRCLKKESERKIGGYHALRIGEEKYATVYLGVLGFAGRLMNVFSRKKSDRVLIKVVRVEKPGGDIKWKQSIKRLKRGLRLVVQSDCKNLMRVQEYRVSSRDITIYSEYRPGVTLDNIYWGKWEKKAAFSVLHQLAKGLQWYGDRNYVNRNIGPNTLFVTLEGEVLIADYSLTKVEHGKHDHALKYFPDDKGTISISTDRFGKPGYLSPEQLEQSLTVDHRSDIWSWGVMGCELMIGGIGMFAGDFLTAIKEVKAFDYKTSGLKTTPFLLPFMNDILEKSLLPESERANGIWKLIGEMNWEGKHYTHW